MCNAIALGGKTMLIKAWVFINANFQTSYRSGKFILVLQHKKEEPLKTLLIMFLEKTASFLICSEVVSDRESGHVHRWYYPGGVLGGLSWRRVCSGQIWLPRPPRGAACEGSSVCTKAERSDRQQSIENVRISTLTLESTVLPLTPSFDIFRGAGFNAAPRETAKAEGGVTGQSPQLKQSSPWGEILQGLLIERTSCTARAVTATSSEHVFLTVPLQSHSEVKMMNWKSISGNLEMVISSAIPSVSKHQYKIEQNHHGHQSSELSKFWKVRRNILTAFWL